MLQGGPIMTPATRLYLAELRASKPAAIRRLRAALKRHRGHVGNAAAELQIASRTLYTLRTVVPEVDQALLEVGQGREGSRRAALAAKRAESLGPKKSTRKTT
jgi:hypothetical protein